MNLIFKITFFLLLYTSLSTYSQTKSLLQQHVEILAADSMEGRGIGTQGHTRALKYIKDQFTSLGLEPLGDAYIHHFEYTDGTYRIHAQNIVGQITGSDPKLKDEYLVIGAHYDHMGFHIEDQDSIIYNGADDNATGVASVIEMARFLKANQNELKRSIILVAFDAEESGLLGSSFLLDDKLVNPEQIKWMLSIDMVGMYTANKGLDLNGMDLITNNTLLINELSLKHQLDVKTSKKKEQQTDTGSFIDERIPAAHAFTGLKSPYHKPEDTAEKIDYEGMIKVSAFLNDVTLELAQQHELVSHASMHKYYTNKLDAPLIAGARLNIGSSKIDFSDAKINTYSKVSFSAGLFAQLKLSQWLALQPEALYDYRSTSSYEGDFNTHSLTTPLNLMLRTPFQDSYSPRLFIKGGVYYSYHFASNDLNYVDKDFKDTNTINESETGLSWGFGVELAQFQVAYTRRKSFTDVFPNHINGPTRFINSQFSIGYKF